MEHSETEGERRSVRELSLRSDGRIEEKEEAGERWNFDPKREELSCCQTGDASSRPALFENPHSDQGRTSPSSRTRLGTTF